MYPGNRSVLPGNGWRTSSYSGQDGDCAEVAAESGGILLRDTKDRAGPVLKVTGAAWKAFTASLKN